MSMWHMKHLWVFIVPSFIVAFATILRQASGPFWLGKNLDPEYAYLMNSLSLTQGLPVGLYEHPGSTLEWAGAIWLYAINFLKGKEELVTEVLTRPEFYLGHMHIILLSILLATLLIAGWLTFRWTGDRVAALLMQVGILMSYTARNSFARMSPEPMLLILGIWLAITVLYHHHQVQQGSQKEPYWQYGLITGMGMGLKLTFLPLWFFPLVLLKRINYAFYLGISGIVFLILTANPLMNFFGFIRFTFEHLGAREGYNRPVELGSTKFQAMIDGMTLLLENIWKLEKPLLLLVLIFLAQGLLVLLVKSHREANNTAFWNLRLWGGLVFTLSAQIILVANGPWARLHYLTPVLGLTGLLAVLSWRWPAMPLNPKLKLLSWGKITYLICIFIMIMGITIHQLPREMELAAAGVKYWQEAHRFKTDNHLVDTTTIYYYRSSSIPYALSFGNILARKHFSQQLSSLYPNFFVFHKWNQKIYNHFGETEVILDDIVRQAGTVLIQGQNSRPPVIPSLEPTAYNKNKTGQFREPSSFVLPTKSPKLWEAKVIFDGSVEWMVLVRPHPLTAQASEMHLPYISGKEPIPFLRQYIDILPKGTALDVAMGEGRNGVFLARKGFSVTGIDMSETNLRKAEALAAEHDVQITTKVVDLEEVKLAPNTYNVIICAYYLQRNLFPQIISALKPGGMALVETYTIDHLKYQPGFRQKYLLQPNELLKLFEGLTVIRYQSINNGHEAYASILVQKT